MGAQGNTSVSALMSACDRAEMTATASARTAPLPLHWNVQQRQVPQPDGSLTWGEPHRCPQFSCGGAEAFAGLWARRKGANPVRIPGGLEFDDRNMDPDTGRPMSVRTRVTFETPEGALFDAD